MNRTLATLMFLAVLATLAFLFMRPKLPPAERGRRLAQATGCFACHGPGGLQGTANPGRTDGTVPTYTGDLMMFADTRDEIRQWIRDGVTEKKAQSESWKAERRRGVLKMPAFRERLSPDQIEDLVAFVAAVTGLDTPTDSLAATGLERAKALGCIGCHGPGGRLALANPRSFKGYVPSWDSDDFAELVRTRAEFDQWVGDGVSRSLKDNPFATFFLHRAVLKMPAYKDHLEPGDLNALWAYVRWLRQSAPADVAR